MKSAVSFLVLLIICCNNLAHAAVCNKSATSSNGMISTDDNRCRQYCLTPTNATCDFSCSYDDCAQGCTAGVCALLCFDSKDCNQRCDTSCYNVSCQAKSCYQNCNKCPTLKCNATELCTQSCTDEICDEMLCQANKSCIQSGYGKMICDSETCEQTCTSSNCHLSCNATTCMQTCNNKNCTMVCNAGVQECTQNCTSGGCIFQCNAANCTAIGRESKPSLPSSGRNSGITYISFFMVFLQSMYTHYFN